MPIDEKALKAAVNKYIYICGGNAMWNENDYVVGLDAIPAILEAYESAKASGQPDGIPSDHEVQENKLPYLIHSALINPGNYTRQDIVNDVIKNIRPYLRGPERESGGWISVHDALPENDREVLMAWADEKFVMQGKYWDGSDTSLRGFCTNKGSHYVGKIGVTHWMPLERALHGIEDGDSK